MTTTDAPTWLDYGPAEFDKRRAPKSVRQRQPEQGSLFFAAVEPLPVKAAKLPPELPGQVDIFGEVTP